MNSKNNSRFFHHYIPKTMPCMIPPISSPRSCPAGYDDHILNLSASMKKHCPLVDESSKEGHQNEISSQSPSSLIFNLKSLKYAQESNDFIASEKVDMNCNDIKDPPRDLPGDGITSDSSSSTASEPDQDGPFEDNECEDGLTEIDVDDSFQNSGDSDFQPRSPVLSRNSDAKKSKSLTFGIDRILSFSRDESDKDEKAPTSPSSPVVPLPKSSNSPEPKSDIHDKYKQHINPNHSILSKLKLCATTLPSDLSRRSSAGLAYFHHSYNPFHHPQQHHVNSVITSPSGGGIHNLSSHHPSQSHHHNHQHPLSHCAECLFLRRYSSGGSSGATNNGGSCSTTRTNINNIPSSSSSSATANNVATNTMQFSSTMATPCGPSSSAISASFTWMANPSIYDNSAIISPVAGFNQHVPLQPSFGLGPTGFSSLATMQQCSSGGSSGRRKRSWSRAVFSNLQRKGLEKRFQLQKYITKPDRRQLAGSLGLTDAQVKVWFQNRRMKWRHTKEGKVSSGTGEATVTSPSSSPVTSTTSSKVDGAMKDKK